MVKKRAFITGVTGQDGSYLAEYLLELGYEVTGLVRRASTRNLGRLDRANELGLEIEEGDITDYHSLALHFSANDYDEVYHLAAQSHVGTSFKQPWYTHQAVFQGSVNLMSAARSFLPHCKFYQASSSEMYGNQVSMWGDISGFATYHSCKFNSWKYDKSEEEKYRNRWEAICAYPDSELEGLFQDERTPFHPQSPYAIAKLAAHHYGNIVFKSDELDVRQGILFNHDGIRRGENFLTRKVTKYIGRVKRGEIEPGLYLGNLDAYRDWGDAEEYVRGMHDILNKGKPGESYVLATGETHSVREFVELAFKLGDLNFDEHVEIDDELIRPCEVPFLRGDATKAKKELGWTPTIFFANLVERMVKYDIDNKG